MTVRNVGKLLQTVAVLVPLFENFTLTVAPRTQVQVFNINQVNRFGQTQDSWTPRASKAEKRLDFLLARTIYECNATQLVCDPA